MARPSASARPFPCPSCGFLGGVQGVRSENFVLTLEPDGTISDTPIRLPSGTNRLQFHCMACGTHWVRIKDFEAACARSGLTMNPLFG